MDRVELDASPPADQQARRPQKRGGLPGDGEAPASGDGYYSATRNFSTSKAQSRLPFQAVGAEPSFEPTRRQTIREERNSNQFQISGGDQSIEGMADLNKSVSIHQAPRLHGEQDRDLPLNRSANKFSSSFHSGQYGQPRALLTNTYFRSQ